MVKLVAFSGVQFKNTQVNYKKMFDRVLRYGQAIIKIGGHVRLDVQDGK